MSQEPSPESSGIPFLLGGGEMGARMRAVDWAQTSLGPAEQWPQSLKTAVRIMLTSRQAMFVWWGDELTNLYNDAYKAIVGGKHPEALGQPASVVWREIWDQIRPRAESAMRRNEGTYDEALRLIMERNGYPEETYYTFSYSPVPNDQGGTGGILCANTDDTQRIVGERQLALLRELAARTADARTFDEACTRSAHALETNPYDLPFALIYLIDPDRRRVSLAGTSGVGRDHPAVPETADLDGDSAWPFAAVARTHEMLVIDLLKASFGELPAGAWGRPPCRAVAVPIAPSGQTGQAGILIAGLNPFRLFDDGYRGFLDLVSAQIAASIANAQGYEEERRRAEALAELDRAKTAFFSNVSHELRTPLTLMLAPLDEILAAPEGEALPESRELLTVVRRNGQRLLKLVNNLLDFSRLEAGRVQAVYEPVDLAACTAELASQFRAAIERAGLRLIVDCPPLPEPVFVDRDMWEKIVLNLLSNAFKYTLDGEIEVSLRAAGGAAVLAVRDTGTGIPAAELPSLFNRFHRVEGARGRTQEGTGIGLALVAELARLHGGTAGVESIYGEGSTFTVAIPLGKGHLPADRVDAARMLSSTALGADPFVEEALRWLPGEAFPLAVETAASTPRTAAPGNGPRPRVLLADDNADMRDYVRRLLAAEYDVAAVADGEAALRAIAQRRPDLVLTDVMMPNLDGFGLLKALREDPERAAIPVILLSARAGEEARVEGLEAGADDYLTKPFSARELLARVAGTLALSKVRREALAREEEILRETDRRKDELLATLAHELRNPLAPIRNGLQILGLAKDSPEILEQARRMMERQLQQMVRLIDDLLDLSRISRGKIDLHRERADLAAVLHSALETSRPLIEQSGHHVDLDLPPAPVFVEADLTRLAQVFANLLNNAAKYTDKGGHIRIAVRPAGREVAVSVRDNGIGIPAAMLPRIFEMFTQVDRSLEKAHGGLGIGLSIVKRLVEMHGGTVEARSPGPGQGSEFVVRLPLLQDAAAEGRPESGEEKNGAPVRRRILVADDNADAAESLATLLALYGNEVRTARDGLEAVAAAAELRPDVILLDIGMPRLNGYDACRRIREQPWGRDAVIIALTGWGQEDDKRRSLEAGFDHHLVKPVEPAALVGLLRPA
ncbi:MAG TPA: ATP-binding protein [Thermoanaerobaculia bacterium]|jgi:signal transduction histidine kinase